MNDFTQQTAIQLLGASYGFCVPLDEPTLEWIGMANDEAVESLRERFVEGYDFTCEADQQYFLTVDCFKALALESEIL